MFRAVCIFLILCSLNVQLQFIDADEDPRLPCPCGNNGSSVNTRVVGGHDAGEGRFPYASCLIDSTWRAEEFRKTTPFCGATLISDSHVITAAHCVRDRSPDIILVDIGDYDFLEPHSGKLRRVQLVTRFPLYKEYSFHSDIALLEFEPPVVWRSGVRAAWLPSPQLQLSAGTIVSVYGWGRLRYEGGHPKVLQSVELPVVENEDCQENFKTHIEPNMLCAGGEKGHDACIGDSGSGLVVRLDNEFVLCGLVSFGRRCALPHVPGVYTRVSSYIEWIYKNTLSSKCKPCIYNAQAPLQSDDNFTTEKNSQ
ncbi:serine protease filzig [Nephila pilipes]|uniref:limulus clotting factor C n=1 Tax=Nephila pilipes TaxID=299642 RepID=A0A8X6IS50_NEPPI|nr:serine protease filzig [Nephila pilipes]